MLRMGRRRLEHISQYMLVTITNAIVMPILGNVVVGALAHWATVAPDAEAETLAKPNAS